MADRTARRLESTVTPEGQVELALVEAEVPAPAADEVLVRVEAAPINPSDIGVMLALGDSDRARLGGPPERPVATLPISGGAMAALRERVGEPMPLGNEGAGTVVETGSGEQARALAGRLVSVVGGGMYSQLQVVKATACLPLPEGAVAEDGAAGFVNPMTALAMLETMRHEGHQALVHTAAASSLGQMLNRLCIAEGVPLVSLVRSPEQVELLRNAGAESVLDTRSASFDEELTAALRRTGARLAFDAIGGGELADRILTAMERAISEGAGYLRYGSNATKQIYVYGRLDTSPTSLRRGYGMAWGVSGWLLTHVLERIGEERAGVLRRQVADGLKTTFATEFSDRMTLTEALDPERIAAYGKPRTAAKFLIVPGA